VPSEGMHNYAIWRNHLEAFLPLLFQPADPPHPTP
jgi:enterochelin esterase-like enzyme